MTAQKRFIKDGSVDKLRCMKSNFTACLALLLTMSILATTACLAPIRVEESKESIQLSAPETLTTIDTNFYWWSPTTNQILLQQRLPITTVPSGPLAGPLYLVDIPSGTTQEIAESGTLPLWSPTGDAILWQSGVQQKNLAQLWYYTPETATSQPLQPSSFGMPTQWLQNGELLYKQDSELWLGTIDPKNASLSEPQLWTDLDNLALGTIAWQYMSPTGDALYFLAVDQAETEYTLWLLTLDATGNQQELQLLTTAPEGIGVCCTWSDDGQFMVFAAFEPEHGLYLVDRAHTIEPQLLVSAAALGDGHFISMDFAADNKHLVFEWSPLPKKLGEKSGEKTEATISEGFPFAQTELYLVSLPKNTAAREERVDLPSPYRLTLPSTGPHNWVQWSPQGNYLTYLSRVDDTPRLSLTQLRIIQ